MSDNQMEAEKKMKRQISICNDNCLKVFEFLSPFKLGIEMAFVSRRFDALVDEHFKTRKWTLGSLRIKRRKNGENDTTEMEIFNMKQQKTLPIPQKPLPNKIIAFRMIILDCFDQNVIDFLQNFRQIFASGTNLCISYSYIEEDIVEFVVRNIWPMLKDNIRGIHYHIENKQSNQLQQFVSSILNDCQTLRLFYSYRHFPCFSTDESAKTCIEQALVSWLLTPRSDGIPKLIVCSQIREDQWRPKIISIKSAFANASSPVNFIIFVWFSPWKYVSYIVPFDLINRMTGERFSLKKFGIKHIKHFLLVRCPIARDEQKWAKWERESSPFGKPNTIGICSNYR